MATREFIDNCADLMNKFERGYVPDSDNRLEMTVYEKWREEHREVIMSTNDTVNVKNSDEYKELLRDASMLIRDIYISALAEKEFNLRLLDIIDITMAFSQKYNIIPHTRDDYAVEECFRPPVKCPSKDCYCEECSMFIENCQPGTPYCKNSGVYLHK